ncbi:MAG: LPP20 family lipoprotein [Gammaproteobacteria bacterium]|nr:LPP20 family lipoprotein [Gammaproteobacteria bacterium]
MNKQFNIRHVMALLLVSTWLGACTHVVVAEPPSGENDFVSSEGLSGKANATKSNERLDNRAIDQAVMQVANNGDSGNATPTVNENAAKPSMPAVAAPGTSMPVPAQPSAPQQQAHECTGHDTPYFNKGGVKSEEVKIRATGYGAPPKAFYSDAQRRLMSMRAAQVDAYRSLAERVKGVQIWGGTTIGDMVVENDRFRVFLDTYLVGARLIMQTPQEDGSFEATVELVIGQKMVQEMVNNQVMRAPNEDNCGNTVHTRETPQHVPSSRVAKSDFYFDRE